MCVLIYAIISFSFHKLLCRKAKKTGKKICKCWDCSDKCELYFKDKKVKNNG